MTPPPFDVSLGTALGLVLTRALSPVSTSTGPKQILKAHHFDPNRHIESDLETGLLRWTNQAPTRLRDDIRTYFLGRREDG